MITFEEWWEGYKEEYDVITNESKMAAGLAWAEAMRQKDIAEDSYRAAIRRWMNLTPEPYPQSTPDADIPAGQVARSDCAEAVTTALEAPENFCTSCHGYRCKYGPKIHGMGCTCCSVCGGTGKFTLKTFREYP